MKNDNKKSVTFECLFKELIGIHGQKLGKEISFEIFAEGYNNVIAKASNDTYIENFTEITPQQLMESEYIALNFKKNHYVIDIKVSKKRTLTKTDYIKLISQASDRYGDKLVELMDKYQAINLESITYEQAKDFYENQIFKLPF